jgi:TolB protein
MVKRIRQGEPSKIHIAGLQPNAAEFRHGQMPVRLISTISSWAQLSHQEMKIDRTILTAALLLACADARPQSKPISLAWQVTHVDHASPSISPDGKRLVYAAVIAGIEQLFTMNLDGSRSSQITHDPINHNNPIWSPDGRKIVYSSESDDEQTIYTIDASGGGEERITPKDQQKYIHPDWSPDGTKIIYCSTDDLRPPQKNASNIYVIDLRSRTVTTLLTGGTNTYASWSPDGKKIVFRKIIGSEMNSEVFVANSDGTDQRNVSNNPAFDGWPAWSPDGAQIAFASNRAGSYKIFLMNADGSNVRMLASTEGRATEPRWAPDGKTVYFTNCYSVAWGTDCEVFAAAANPSLP